MFGEVAVGRRVCVNGPVIVGAGPAGLAVAACLREQNMPFLVLERADCIASLWQNRTYHRLKLHLPKKFCELPNLPFPDSYPEYPSKHHFIQYLQSYAHHFNIHPQFNHCVQSAMHDDDLKLWRVKAVCTGATVTREVEYLCQWLVVATGENAEQVLPDIEGLGEFQGEVVHTCDYKSGEEFAGKKVLVVGCGNSGMEVSLDLCKNKAETSMVVRSSVHVLPREILGRSTFELAVTMMRWLPLWMVDKILLLLARLILGNLEKYGLKRPSMGPLMLKNREGKTPVLDIGALEKIRSSEIKVVGGIRRFCGSAVELVNGERLEVESVILATGYRSNVPSWLHQQDTDFFCKNGFSKSPFPNGWKGKEGLYAVGFTNRGLLGISMDAIRIAQDIGILWKKDLKQKQIHSL